MAVQIWDDAGHGGGVGAYDPADVATGDTLVTREDDINLAVALIFGAACERSGLTVGYTRKTDIAVALADRAAAANAANAQLFISFHCNSYTAEGPRGIEVYAYSAGSTGDALAQKIYSAVTPLSPWADRGVKYNTTWVVMNDTNMPSVLIEMGFISTTEEEALMRTAAYQNSLGETVAKTVVEFLGLTYVPPNAEPVVDPVTPPATATFVELMAALDDAKAIATTLQNNAASTSANMMLLQAQLDTEKILHAEDAAKAAAQTALLDQIRQILV